MKLSLQSVKKIFGAQKNNFQRQCESLSDRFNHISRRKLPNGVPVAIRSNSGSGFITMKVTVGAGSLLDPPGKEGLAHMLEHMALIRDEALVAMQEEFRLRGGVNNAETDSFQTVYDFRIPAGQANEKLLYALAGRMLGQQGVDPTQLAEEKEVVVNEMMEKIDKDRGNMREAILSQAFGHDSLSGDIVGTPASLATIGVADLMEFQRKNYVASNTEIEITGELSGMVSPYKELGKSFAALPTSESSPPPAIGDDYKGGARHIEGSAALTYVSAAFPFASSEMFSADCVFLNYLTLALTDRLRGAKERKCYSPEASADDAYRQQRLLIMSASTSREKAGAILPAMAGILNEVASGKIDARLFEAAVAMDKREFIEHIQKALNDKNSLRCRAAFERSNRSYLRELDQLASGHLSALAEKITHGRPPTLVTKGDVTNVQSYEEFLRQFTSQDVNVKPALIKPN